MTTRYDSDAAMRLEVTGDVAGTSAVELESLITAVIIVDRPDVLVVDLQHVTALTGTGVQALLVGYRTAIEDGTSYRVVRAHGEARQVLLAAGIIDVLANSDDLGALLAAMLTPAGPGTSSGSRT